MEPTPEAARRELTGDFLGRDRGLRRGRRVLTEFRDLARLAYWDPAHVAERLTVVFVEQLGEPSRAWAKAALGARGIGERQAIAIEQTRRAALVSRVDGALAGTPFLVALVPAYIAHLWQEGVLVLRLAALYGHDPRGDRMAAEFLVLRGVHPTVEAAETALARVKEAPAPGRFGPRNARNWFAAVRMLAVFGGFLGPPTVHRRPARRRLRSVIRIVFGIALWVITWIFPLTFMLAMSWSCQGDAKALGRRALTYYGADPETARKLRPRGWREALRAVALALSLAVPIGFVVAANQVRRSIGLSVVSAAGAVVGLSLVIAMTMVVRHG